MFDAWEYMQRTQVESSLVKATLAAKYLATSGMLALMGSVAAIATTRAPRLLGYACAKAAVHQPVHQLAAGLCKDKNAHVLRLVPEVLDTPVHRAMSGDNSGTCEVNWTPCDAVAEKLLVWAERGEERPKSGSLVSVTTQVHDDDGGDGGATH